jgi:hypothetical protein
MALLEARPEPGVLIVALLDRLSEVLHTIHSEWSA